MLKLRLAEDIMGKNIYERLAGGDKMIRIKDIAKEAGVSATTVSNVIHGNTRKVSKETIEKIQKLLEKYSYIPSMGAVMLAGNSSHLIGVLIGGRKTKIEHSIFVDEMIRELEYQLYKRNYYMIVHYTDSVNESLKFAATWAVEGLITLTISEDDTWEIYKKCNVPLVSVDVYYQDGHEVPNVGTADYKGGYLMGEYLLRQGLQRITFFSDNDVGVDNQRWKGLEAACRDGGYPLEKARHILLNECKAERRNFYREHMERIARESDALFYASDYYAMEGIVLLNSIGLSVPEDISVAGFDDSEFARMSCPELTTIHQSIKQKAVATAEKMFCYLRGDKNVLMCEELPVSLKIRESVKMNKKEE